MFFMCMCVFISTLFLKVQRISPNGNTLANDLINFIIASSYTPEPTSLNLRAMQCRSVHLLYRAMICTQPIPRWTAVTGKYVMQLQSSDIMNVCFAKPNHTLLLTQPCTFSKVHPRGAIHCVNDAEYTLPPTHQPFL